METVEKPPFNPYLAVLLAVMCINVRDFCQAIHCPPTDDRLLPDGFVNIIPCSLCSEPKWGEKNYRE